MITKEVRNNYKALIEEANSLLKLQGDNVMTNLDDYFMCLKDIAQKVQKGEIDPKFLVLPNDEGYFEIDANSRKINIPSRFASYGAGVQGDEVAEIIYFSIDRYFDIHDLYDKEILIQWENAAVPNPDKGLSVTINKTLQVIPNKVVFGWPLTEEITAHPGKVKFSVRFFDRKESTPEDPQEYLLYSFSTLTSEIKINSGLDFDIDISDNLQYTIVDKNDQIYNHIRNSVNANPLWPAKMPIFELDLPSTADMTQDEDGNWYALLEANVYYDEEDDSNGVGITKYTWKYKNKDNIWIDNIADQPGYVESTDKTPQNDTYYVRNEDGTYSILTIIPGAPFPPEDEYGIPVTLYEQVASHKAIVPGTYIVTATNVYGRGNERSNESHSCIIPTAQQATFTIDADNNYNYILAVNEEGEVTETGKVAITVHTVDKGILTSCWVRSDDSNALIAEEFDNGPGSIGEQIGDDQIMTLTIPPEEDMYYFVKTTNWKNNDEIISYSDGIRVTKPAEKVNNLSYTINDIIKTPEDNRIAVRFNPSMILGVTPIGDIKSDEFEYTWKKKDYDGDNIIWQVAPNSSNSSTYTPLEAGEYRCWVYNIYNKSKSPELESASFDLE